MKNQAKTFTKKTELVFTTIEIKRTGLLSSRYTSYFEYGFAKHELVKHEIDGYSFEHCLQRVKKFLDCEIDERHYIIK